MRDDISEILRKWPFEPGRLNVRVLEVADGHTVIQIRTELGLVQMETKGRPDGRRIGGSESLLDLLETDLDQHVASGRDIAEFQVDAEQAQELREEAALYYQRYVALMSIEDFESVIEDTNRNLRMFDFCRAHCAEAEDRTVLEQFRPQVIATRARAEAAIAVREGRGKAALKAIDLAIQQIRNHFPDDAAEEIPEITLLQGMREVLVPKLPSSQRHELEQRLKAAIEAENYELAAVLRDELRMMR